MLTFNPLRVGVAPGTTTFRMGAGDPRAVRQAMLLFPPGKYKHASEAGLGLIQTPFVYVGDIRRTGLLRSRREREPDYDRGGTLRGHIPTDFQLSTQYNYTPVMSQWVPFQQGVWTTPPFVPPSGNAVPNPIRPGIWAPPIPTSSLSYGLGQDAAPLDPAQQAVIELKKHQDRMYILGMISAAAVASTALINVFRYGWEARTHKRRRGSSVDIEAQPTPTIAGHRRRRRRRR